jgi:hypothetical protein
MVDPATNDVLLGCHRSGVTILVRDCISGRHLVGAVVWLGTSNSEVLFHHSCNTSHLWGSILAFERFVVSAHSGFLEQWFE